MIPTPIQQHTTTVSEPLAKPATRSRRASGEPTTIEMLDALEAALAGAVRVLQLLPPADRGKALSGARGPCRRVRNHPFSRIEEL